jgi:4-carboxymuconolactone decarboxylase
MVPNKQAQKNHDEMFSRSPLHRRGHRSRVDRYLRQLRLRRSAPSRQFGYPNPPDGPARVDACQSVRECRAILAAALTVGVTPVEAKENLYPAIPYLGIAKVLDFISATNEVFIERGIKLTLPGQSTTTPENRAVKGLAVQKEIIGSDTVEKLYASAPADEQHIQRYLSANCFGDHYTRTGIDAPTRELLTFSMLVALGECERQVKGHVAANLHVGNTVLG